MPFRIFAATKRDVYRKPMPGMWYEIESMFKSSGVEIGSSSSYCRPVRNSPMLHTVVTPSPTPRYTHRSVSLLLCRRLSGP